MPYYATVKNVVATAKLNCTLDLDYILAQTLLISTYNARVFSGLLMRLSSPNTQKNHAQLYRNGKVTVNGATSTADARLLADHYCQQMIKLGYITAAVTDFTVVNMVASGTLRHRVKLDDIYYKLPKVTYDRERFPGLCTRLSDATCVIFNSEKFNILGAKSDLNIEASLLEIEIYL